MMDICRFLAPVCRSAKIEPFTACLQLFGELDAVYVIRDEQSLPKVVGRTGWE